MTTPTTTPASDETERLGRLADVVLDSDFNAISNVVFAERLRQTVRHMRALQAENERLKDDIRYLLREWVYDPSNIDEKINDERTRDIRRKVGSIAER